MFAFCGKYTPSPVSLPCRLNSSPKRLRRGSYCIPQAFWVWMFPKYWLKYLTALFVSPFVRKPLSSVICIRRSCRWRGTFSILSEMLRYCTSRISIWYCVWSLIIFFVYILSFFNFCALNCRLKFRKMYAIFRKTQLIITSKYVIIHYMTFYFLLTVKKAALTVLPTRLKKNLI